MPAASNWLDGFRGNHRAARAGDTRVRGFWPCRPPGRSGHARTRSRRRRHGAAPSSRCRCDRCSQSGPPPIIASACEQRPERWWTADAAAAASASLWRQTGVPPRSDRDRRSVSPCAVSRRAALTRAAIRKSWPHRLQTCCAIKSRWAKAAMPSPQRGHRSRKPQPCSQHEMRVAHRQRRRKYGASSAARQCGQNCNQVEALRPTTWRSGNSSWISGPAPSVIIAIRARATPVCRYRTSSVPSGSAQSSRADHMPAPSPRTSLRWRGATPFASASRCSQLDSSSSAFGATVTGQRSACNSR